MCLFSEIATQDRAEELYPRLERELKKQMQSKIQNEEFHPLAIADQVLLFEGLTNYGFDELAVLLLQRLSFLLQKMEDQQEDNQFDFLTKGFNLFYITDVIHETKLINPSCDVFYNESKLFYYRGKNGSNGPFLPL